MSRYTFHEVCGQNVEISAAGTEARLARLGDEVGLVFTATPLTCGEQPPLTLQNSLVCNLRPLSFHRVRGECINTDRVDRVKRTTSSSNSHAGLVFSAETVRVNERVCLYISADEVQVGFTSCDPATAARPGTDTVAEELYDASRYWLGSDENTGGRNMYLYVNNAGVVHVGVHCTPERSLCSGVSTGAPLWAVVRVTSGAVECNNAVDVSDTWRYSPLRGRAALSAAPSAPQQPPVEGVPSLRRLSFHPVHGKSVAVNDHVSAECTEPLETSRDGLVFSARHVELNEKIYIRTVALSGLRCKVEVGFTDYDPATLTSTDNNVVDVNLADRTKYWTEALAENCNFRFINFYVNASGEVHLAGEGITEYLFFSGVDVSAPLWAVVKMIEQNITVCCSKGPEIRPEHAHSTNVGTTITQANIRDQQNRLTSSRDLQDPLTCTVCMDNVKDTALISCGHMCVCYTCALQLRQGHVRGLCPVCRARIEGILRVYS